MKSFRLSIAVMIAAFLSVTTAQSQDVAKHKKKVKAAQPTVEKTTAVPPDPVAMQKWFSGAVGDILTDTGRTLNNLQQPAR